ncbi:alpha/beta fold hydrolase [Flavihumibacter sp.]|uniref:alpha/beta fold hydrolase n=1 Tax=Flavihumibacter sp. TaxID=1913981 RepID=UPI002FC636EC
MLSGGGINRRIKDFSKCIPELSKHFRVIAPDTPGQGRSEQIEFNLRPLTDFMSQLIDSLKIDSGYVMGWSDGPIVGLQLANRRADKIKKVMEGGANNGVRGFVIPDKFFLLS